jgi:hypothetical protein
VEGNAGGWRKLPNEEQRRNLYCLADIFSSTKQMMVRWVGHVAYVGEMRNSYKVVVGKTEGSRPIGRRRHRLEENM